jgi:ABC-type dipeptide/oligopeptide/nickel transport system permease subunit
MEASVPVIGQVKRVKRAGALQKAWYRFTRRRAAVAGLAFILFEIVFTLCAPILVDLKIIYYPYYNDYTATYQPPSAKHLFGTDEFGRDMVSRIIYGAQVSYAVGIGANVIGMVLGLIIGSMAGLRGGWLDYLVMRIIDVLSSVPTLLLYILLMMALGGSLLNIIVAMSITGWIGIARLVRGQVLSLKQTDYVRAARAMGANTSQIITSHMLRNSMTPVIISAALGVPGAMFGEAALSYLGLGIAPPTPSWGQMIGYYQASIQAWPWLVIFPALILALTMLAWILMGDGLRDALDPNIRV